jgi:hypothetical protein
VRKTSSTHQEYEGENTREFLVGGRTLDAQKAADLVENSGTAIEKYRLSFLLGKERIGRIPLIYLRGFRTVSWKEAKATLDNLRKTKKVA